MRRAAITLMVFTSLSMWATNLLTRPPDTPEPQTVIESQSLNLIPINALPDTLILAEYDFDDGAGGPDPQGWITVDRTYQDTYFHVDDFSGVDAPYASLEGAQSLWCGQETIPDCVTCPGYGNGWIQYFESVAFPASGDVTVDFLIEYDSEPDYDFTYVQYLSRSDVWQSLASFDSKGAELASVVVPTDSIDGSVKLRFQFFSDGTYSDEDGLYNSFGGAVVIDSVTVADTTGVLDFQDFEAEAPGATSTADGDWTAGTYPAFGDYAALFDGTTVLQEDSLVVNTTYLWGFFNGSTADYTCGGHPEQAAVPYGRVPGSKLAVDYIHNEIWSPYIDLSQDKNGTPITSELGGLIFEFDVYRDLPSHQLVSYIERVRYLVDGQPTAWVPEGYIHGSPAGVVDWHRFSWDFVFTMVPGATHVQLAIGCIDQCPRYCGASNPGDCHSHAPLIDNVRLFTTVVDTIVVTNADDDGPGSFRDAITAANANYDRNVILFAIPGPGPHVIQVQTNLPTVANPTVIDATSQPGYSGTPVVVIDGGGPAAGLRGLYLRGSSSVLRGIEIRNCALNGLTLSGTNYAVVEKNYIHHNYLGIRVVSPAKNNVIGGTTPELGNKITDNTHEGITIVGFGSYNNSVLCNSIARNGDFGIDLRQSESTGVGVTPNDDQDPDEGPNHYQNFPILRWANSGMSAIGASLNSVPNRSFTVQFFSNLACDASGNGEGEDYLGAIEVLTGPDGNVDFTLMTGESFADGEYIAATATDDFGNTSEFSECLLVSGATAVDGDPVVRAALYPAVPNPFNPSTVIRYDVPSLGAYVRIVVYDVTGRRVTTLVDGRQSAGAKRVSWNGKNDVGSDVATGVYFYRMTTRNFVQTRKMVLLK